MGMKWSMAREIQARRGLDVMAAYLRGYEDKIMEDAATLAAEAEEYANAV